jgi:zinc protease
LRFGASSANEYFYVNFATPSAYKDEAFELLRLAFTAPRFDAEPMARARAQYVTGIEAGQRSPVYIGSEVLRRELYGKHYLATDMATMKRGHESVTVEDIKAQRARLLVREGLKIAVAGNIDAATLGSVLDKLLGNLPAKASASPMPVPVGSGAGCQHIPLDVPQAVVQFGSLGPTLSFRQRLASVLLDTIMTGGIASSRLGRELREKRGLVYGISSSWNEYTKFGVFSGSFSAKMSDVPEALAILRRELKRMVDEGPTEEEVTAVKATQLGRTLLGLDTGAAIANLLQSVQISKLPITYLDDVAGNIESVTRQDVWETAKLLLNPDRLVVSIVGEPGQTKVCEAPARN